MVHLIGYLKRKKREFCQWKHVFAERIIYFREYLSTHGYIYVDISIPYKIKDNYNWGDDVNRVLIEFISGKKIIPARCKSMSHPHYICIGSVLQWYADKNAIVWGTGLIKKTEVKECRRICAVRGPLTRQELIRQGHSCPEVYGDPALLFPRYYNPPIKKRFKIGIIPHYSEIDKPIVKQLIQQQGFHFINIKHYGKWSNFIDEILSCEYIISSSLHGCIISDAYNIPNIWCKFSEYEAEGDWFKFKDYYQSVHKKIEYPIFISKESNKDSIINRIIQEWTKNDIDLDLLMKACPFVK